MAGFLRKKSAKTDATPKPISRPTNVKPTVSPGASPPSTPLFARFASSQSGPDAASAQKPIVSGPMMLSPSRRESGSPTKRHASASQAAQYGDLANGRDIRGPAQTDYKQANNVQRSVSAQIPNPTRIRNNITPVQTRTQIVEKPLPNIAPEPPRLYSPPPRISSATSGPGKKQSPVESQRQDSRPIGAGASDYHQRPSMESVNLVPPGRTSSKQDLPLNNISTNNFHNNGPHQPPTVFRQPVRNDAPPIENDGSSADLDLWPKSANIHAFDLGSATPPPQESSLPAKLPRQPSQRTPSQSSPQPPMRGKPLIFSAMATVGTESAPPPAPPRPTYPDPAQSYPSPPAEHPPFSQPTQFTPRLSSLHNLPDTSHSNHNGFARKPSNPRLPPTPHNNINNIPPSIQEQHQPQRDGNQVPQQIPRKHSSRRLSEAPRTLTKPRPTTPTKAQRPSTPKQRPSTPKQRPITPSSPENSVRRIPSPDKNSTDILTAPLVDDDPFAKSEGVRLLQSPSSEVDKNGFSSHSNGSNPLLQSQSTTSLSMASTISRDALDFSRPSTGHDSLPTIPPEDDEPKSVDTRPLTPPPPSPAQNSVPPSPEGYRSTKKRRGDKHGPKEVPTEVKVLSVREDRPAEPFPLRLFVAEAPMLSSLISYLTFFEWCRLLCVSKDIRSILLESPHLREEVLERYLDTVGYLRWMWSEPEPLTLTLEDLHNYMRGVSIPTHEYGRVSEAVLQNRSVHPSQRDTELFQSVLEKEQQLVVATRAYNRVLLRLRCQAEKEASNPNPSSTSMSPSSYKNTNSPRGSQPNSRAPSPTRSTFSHNTHGHNQPASIAAPPSSAGRSPLFRIRRAPLLRVFVPSPEGDWLSDNSVLECEQELKRAGVAKLVRFGDVIWDIAVGDEGNVGRLISDGKYLLDLDYTYTTVGDLPKYIPALAFPPSYFHRVIRSGPASSNPIIRMNLTPWGPEIAANLQLLQDRVRTETPQGSYHNVVRWVHRSSFVIRPTSGNSSSQGRRSASRTRPGRIPIPDTNLFVDPGWYGTIVVETEGTNESLADLQDRCGPGAFPPRAIGAADANKTANAREKDKDAKLVYRILRERSRPAEIWIRAASPKERLM